MEFTGRRNLSCLQGASPVYQNQLSQFEIAPQRQVLENSLMPKIALSLGAWSEHDFVHALVEGIDFRMQDIEYKFSLIQQEFTREVKYAHFRFAPLPDCCPMDPCIFLTNLRLIQRYASEPNDSSYIFSEMVPAYRAAAGESG